MGFNEEFTDFTRFPIPMLPPGGDVLLSRTTAPARDNRSGGLLQPAQYRVPEEESAPCGSEGILAEIEQRTSGRTLFSHNFRCGADYIITLLVNGSLTTCGGLMTSRLPPEE